MVPSCSMLHTHNPERVGHELMYACILTGWSGTVPARNHWVKGSSPARGIGWLSLQYKEAGPGYREDQTKAMICITFRGVWL